MEVLVKDKQQAETPGVQKSFFIPDVGVCGQCGYVSGGEFGDMVRTDTYPDCYVYKCPACTHIVGTGERQCIPEDLQWKTKEELREKTENRISLVHSILSRS